MKLTKREYLGEGYIHHFIHNETGEHLYVPCTQEEYERLGLPNGSQFNPKQKGYTWVDSAGRTIKVDTPDTMLHEGDYCEKDVEIHAILPNIDIVERYQKFSVDAVDVQGNLDESKKIEK